MYSLIKYLIGSKSKPQELETQCPIPEPPKRAQVKNCTRNTRTNTVYLVIEKETQNPLGIFDSLELAKQNGQKITHYNCIIVPFRINDPCKYLFTPTFEDLNYIKL
jgi:hypothetical protein